MEGKVCMGEWKVRCTWENGRIMYMGECTLLMYMGEWKNKKIRLVLGLKGRG
jgi:hypothetical protein